MTVLTLGPSDEDAAVRPLPWHRMAWVTWRQHRPTLISVPAVLGVVAAFLLIEGLKIHHDFATLTACHPTDTVTCAGLSQDFTNTDWPISNIILILMNFVPALLGAFAGAPVLARELETGTFRYAWTQGFGRERMTVARIALLAVVIMAVVGALGELFAWFFQPALLNSGMSVLEKTVFDTRGISFPAWALASFAIGVFMGMLIRRIVPAMACTLGAYFGLDLLAWLVLRNNYPVSGFWPTQFFEGGWLLVLSVLLIAATVVLVRRRAA
jgi:ABC-type transport system involved in multi-copper enzyme maturation permease subunit